MTNRLMEALPTLEMLDGQLKRRGPCQRTLRRREKAQRLMRRIRKEKKSNRTRPLAILGPASIP